MSSSKFDVLAALILSGEATEKQRIEFEEILNTSDEKKAAFEKLKRVWHTDLRNGEEAYQKQNEILWQRYQAERQVQRGKQYNIFLKVAAVMLLMVAAGLTFYLSNTRKSDSDQDNVVAINMVVKETRAGEKLKTRLPDGTIVNLNAGSRIVYPEYFTDAVRLVRLTGEGYFDVFEDKEKPFTVRTESMDITALGTAFGVDAYSENLHDQVALVSGKLLIKNVRDQEVNLDSGQTITISREDYSFSKSDLDYLTQIAWKDGVICFNENSFNEIKETLELTYGVQFIIGKELKSIRDEYTGTFKNESLENILEVLSFSMNFNYEMNGKEILIKEK